MSRLERALLTEKPMKPENQPLRTPPRTVVKSIMGKSLITVEPDATLAVADLAMMFAHSRHVPVTKDGRLLGILSLRDVLAAQLSSLRSSAEERRQKARSILVRDVMKSNPYVVDLEDDVIKAAHLCHRHHFSSIPVVRRGELVGIVTTSDLVEHTLGLLSTEAAEIGVIPMVSRLMTPSPIATLFENDHLDLAGVLMRSGAFRHLPVMNGEHLVGIVSDRDILSALTSSMEHVTAAERLWEKASIKAGDVMTRSPHTISPDKAAIEAGRKLLRKKIGALPVLRTGKLIGMLTEMDFLSYLMASGPIQVASV